MILAAALAGLVALVLEAAVVLLLDRRAIRRERLFWEDLRTQAQDGYGRVFDWAEVDR